MKQLGKTKIPNSETEWKRKLGDGQYKVLREKATELPFTGKLLFNKDKGIYSCAGCGNLLFSSDTKFESGTGWPSFWKPFSDESIEERSDNSLLMKRIEIVCKKCKGHLGHVFDDGPKPTGQRFCLNSCALEFEKR